MRDIAMINTKKRGLSIVFAIVFGLLLLAFVFAVSNTNEPQVFLVHFDFLVNNNTSNTGVNLLSPVTGANISANTTVFQAQLDLDTEDTLHNCSFFIDGNLTLTGVLGSASSSLDYNLLNGPHTWSVLCAVETVNITNQTINGTNQTVNNTSLLNLVMSSSFNVNTLFSLITDKATYDYGEIAQITLNAPENASGDILIFPKGSEFSGLAYIDMFNNASQGAPQPFPLIIPFNTSAALTINPSLNVSAQDYTLFASFNYFQVPLVLNLSFTVNPPQQPAPPTPPPTPSVTLNPNVSDPKVNENVRFSGTLTDASGSSVYTINYGDGQSGSTVSSTNSFSFEHAYSSTGTYTVNVSVTNSNGDTSRAITISVNEADTTSPTVELLDPADNAVIQDTTISFDYRAFDNSSMQCGFYWYAELENNPGFYNYSLHSTQNSVQSGENKTFTVSGIDEGEHLWTVGCDDGEGNSITYANERKVTVNLTGSGSTTNNLNSITDDNAHNTNSVPTESTLTESTIDEMKSIIDQLQNKNVRERQLVEKLQIVNLVREKIEELKRVARDINNIQFRQDLSEAEKEAERTRLLQNIETIKGETPSTFALLSSEEYVKNDITSDMTEVVTDYLNKKNIKLPERKVENFAALIEDAQKHITVTTSSNIVDFTYMNGRKETVTIIVKDIISANDSLQKIIEVIPKTLASDVSEIDFRNEFIVIKQDPIVEMNIAGELTAVYTLKGNRDINEVRKTDTLAVIDPNAIDLDSISSITGFTILRGSNGGAISWIISTIITLIVLTIILFQIFRDHVARIPWQPKILFDSGQREKFSAVHKRINEAQEKLHKGDHLSSSQKYKEALGLVRDLHPSGKKQVKSRLLTLHSNLDFFYINKLLDDAFACVQHDPAQAQAYYQQITGLFRNISPSHKQDLQERCLQLYQQLQQVPQ